MQPLIIDRIETFAVPPRWLFVRVETRDGAIGRGEASLEGHGEAVEGVFASFRDRFIGRDAADIEDIWQVAYRGGFYRGGPALMSALSGLDQALWDLKGRALGVPVWQLLGGKVRDKAECYAWIGGDNPMARRLAERLEEIEPLFIEEPLLSENIGGASVALSAEDLRDIETALAKITVQGDRYPAHLQARVGR